MKIAYNPKTAAVITTATAANDDILFDLNARKVWAKGLRMGADWADISSKPSSLKNPAALTTFGVVYDGSVAKTVTTSTFISQVNEGTSTVTDGTMLITSYASNNGFSDTNAVNIPYKRKASHLWDYIKTKTDGRYLKLTGGTMASNALITFADSGSWDTGKGPQGARGGLYWSGQSDYAKLYAEETAGDNLDLVIQFGDDNSNGLSIRNKSNVQTSYISAGGVITTGTFKGNLDWSYITNKPNTFTPSAHEHTYILDIGNNKHTTFAYSKVGLTAQATEQLAAWNGYELRAIHKSQLAGMHTHAWNSLTHSSTTANQAILTNGSANGWKLYTLNISAWDNAASKAHSHANKSVLDGITSGLISNWNTAYTFVHTITGTDTDNVINKWDEIVNFLAGITEDNKLNTLLNSKLSIQQLSAKEVLTTKTNNALFWINTKGTASSITTGPFTDHPYALLSITNFSQNDTNGKFFYRSRLAFSSAGDIKVASCHHENEYKQDETWYNVLTSKNTYINNGKGVINGTTITQVDNATNAVNANVASKVYGQVGDTGSHELVRCDMNNDQFRIIAGSNGNNNGWAEIATADDGSEPIYVRQYSGVFSSVVRTLTLLDANGFTHFPSYINIGGNENNNSSPDRVWGSNGSDSYLRSYRTSALRVAYANSAGNADTVDGAHLSDIKNWSDRTASVYWKAGWYKVASAQTATNTEAFLTLDVNAAQSNGHATLFIRKRADSKPYFICIHNNNLNLADFRLYYNGMSMALYARVPNDWNGRVFRIISEGKEGVYDHIWTLYSNISSTDPNAISAEGGNPYINPTYSGRVDWSNSSDKATRLQTSRTLWGQSFDGTGNVSGSLSGVANIQFSANNTYDIGSNSNASRYIYTYWLGARSGQKLELGANNSGFGQGLCLDTNLNVGIGTNTPAYKLQVMGNVYATSTVTSAGFIHSAVTKNANQYVLTADGGYTFLNQASNELAHEFSKNITVTSEWTDIEDFYGGNQSFLTQPGTYIVQVYYKDASADGMYEGYFSGIMSWYTGKTNSNNADEIVLHRVGHAYANTIYLRTRESLSSEANPYTKLQISANSDLKQHTYKFKFKRIC